MAEIAQGENQKRLTAKSADYSNMSQDWHDVADFLAGHRAVVQGAERYLAKYPDETNDEYMFRLSVAKFTNIYRDVLQGLTDKPFEETVSFVDPASVPQQYKDFAEDIDGSGRDITMLAKELMFNGIAYALDFLFVDMPKVATVPGVTRTRAQDKADGVRPLWSRIRALNVYEVQTKVVKGEEWITYIRIFEPARAGTPDRFREMEQLGDVARYTIWQWNETAKDYVIHERGTLAIGRIPIVPFITGSRDGRTFTIYPMLQDAKELQKVLYRAESNLEVTKTFTAYPMLVGMGVTPDYVGDGGSKKIKRLVRGPGMALYAPFTAAGATTDWKYIEPAGSSLTFLASDVKEIKQDLRELGKQPLTVSSGNLTVITTAVAAGKAKSACKSAAQALSNVLNMAWYFTALWWNDAANAPKSHVYDEFDEFVNGANDIGNLIQMNNNGKISDETLWEEAQRRGTLSSDFDPEEEKLRLLAQVPNSDGMNNPDNQPPM
jgi:hypothetical protein